MYRPHFSVPLAVIFAGITGASSAHATVRVGYAMMVERNVSGTLSGQQRKVLKGDDVFENDFIRTETESSARLLFVDKTQLMLGPTAIAKLDRLVFNPDQSVSDIDGERQARCRPMDQRRICFQRIRRNVDCHYKTARHNFRCFG